jgi:hypothetical protein
VRRLAIAFAFVGIGACGRFDFGNRDKPPDAGNPRDDAAATADSPPDAPPMLLPCGSPSRVSFGNGFDALIASSTPNGYQVLAVDGNGNLSGSVFELQSGSLVTIADRVALDTAQAGTLGAVQIGSQTLLASIYGRPTPAGTKLRALSADLSPLGTASTRAGVFGGDVPVATHDHTYAFATVDGSTKQVDAHPVDTSGADIGSLVKLVDGAEGAGNVAIAESGTGFVVTYVSSATSPNSARIELVDAAFNRLAGPITANTAAADDALRVVAAWAPTAKVFAVAWYNKDSTDGDDVWYQIRDANLGMVTPPLKIGPSVYLPYLIADTAGTGFWIAYRSYATSPDKVLAGHIDATGVLTPRSVLGSNGGGVDKFTLIARDGQPVLVWTETGGIGPDLYLDPMCGG